VKHISKSKQFPDGEIGGDVSSSMLVSMCGRREEGDTLVTAAMQSDCDDCRTAVNVGRVGDVRWDGRGKLGVQPEVAPYEPQPWEHIKTIEEERRTKTAQQHNAEAGSTVGSYSFIPDDKKSNNRRKKK
jgi:hypothetical protein